MPVVEHLGASIEVRERAAPGGAEYSFSLPVPGTATNANVVARVSLGPEGTRAVVHVRGVPDCRRHRYGDHSLCMWFEPDGPNGKWMAADGLDALVVHVARHLFQEAVCRAGDSWPGDESPGAHLRPRTCTTCGGQGA